MSTTVEGVVLRVVPYSDRVCIATLYTDLWGATTFSLPVDPKSRTTTTLLQPLRGLQVITPSQLREPIKRIAQLQLIRGTLPLAQRPICSAYFLYLAQILSALLGQEPEDQSLYSAVTYAIDLLDRIERYEEMRGFDLALLVSILRLQGYLPDKLGYSNNEVDTSPSNWLDLKQWMILPIKTDQSVPITSLLSKTLPKILRYDLHSFDPKAFSTVECQELRRLLLLFAEIHSPCFKLKHISPMEDILL